MCRHIVVTGGCGFIGSNFIIEWMKRYPQDKITNIDSNTYAGVNLLERPEEIPQVQWDENYGQILNGDITDWNTFEYVNDHDPIDAIFHFAAETHVDRSIDNSIDFVKTNVIGTRNVLEFAKWKKIDKVILMSTDEVYGSTYESSVPTLPHDRLNPTSPYSASKAGADLLSLSYGKTHNLPVRIVRSVNVYGPRQLPEKFIPLFINKALKREKMPLYGDGLHRRTWLYIDDCIDGIIKIHDADAEMSIWHLGSLECWANIHVAEMICQMTDCEEELITYVTDRPAHDRGYFLDWQGTTWGCGWQPKIHLREGLRYTIQWMKENNQLDVDWTPSFIQDDL